MEIDLKRESWRADELAILMNENHKMAGRVIAKVRAEDLLSKDEYKKMYTLLGKKDLVIDEKQELLDFIETTNWNLERDTT